MDAYLEDKVEPYLPQLQKILQDQIRKEPNKYALGIPASALKYRNIPPILDSIVSYFPSPKSYYETLKKEIKIQNPSAFDKDLKDKSKKSIAKKKNPEKELENILKETSVFFIFKRQLHPQLGQLAYGRLYSGNLHHGLAVKSLFSEIEHKIGSMYRVRANEFSEVKSVGVGDIVCVTVPDSVKSGDYIVSGSNADRLKEFLPPKYKQPRPVFISSLLFNDTSDRE